MDDALPDFDLSRIKPFYADDAPARNAKIGLADDLRFSRAARKRHYQHLLHVSNAAKHIRALPAAGETLHCIMRGTYNAWDLVPALLQLAAPATIRHLHVATLGFSASNVRELIDLLDRRSIERVTFVCSLFFRCQTEDVWSYLHHQLAERGQQAVAIRCHAKILLFDLSDGRRFASESSANLRSCNNIEQFCLTHDAELHAFHRQWIEQVAADALAAEPALKARASCPAAASPNPAPKRSSAATPDSARSTTKSPSPRKDRPNNRRT